jgi:hypothetical protein
LSWLSAENTEQNGGGESQKTLIVAQKTLKIGVQGTGKDFGCASRDQIRK